MGVRVPPLAPSIHNTSKAPSELTFYGDIMTTIENITMNAISEHERELIITLPSVQVTKEFEQALNKVQQVASRPGFRPGKLPKNMVMSFYGTEIKEKLVKKLVEQSFKEACQSENLTPITEPKVEPVGECERERAFTYRAWFQVKPKIEIKKFEGLSIEVPNLVFGDDDVEGELNSLREGHATFVSPEGRVEIIETDLVECDSTVLIGGVMNESFSHKDYAIPLFDKEVPDYLKDALLGKKVGDQAEASYTMPSDHQEEEIRGKECTMVLNIKSIKERVLPALDDDFAKDYSEKFESLEDLRNSVVARFKNMVERRNSYYKQDAITRILVENNTFSVPPALIERMALTLINRELEYLPREAAENAVKMHWKSMWESVQGPAEYRVKSQLIYEALIKEMGIEASDDEIADYKRKVREVEREDAEYTIQLEKLFSLLEKTSNLTVVEKPLFPKE